MELEKEQKEPIVRTVRAVALIFFFVVLFMLQLGKKISLETTKKEAFLKEQDDIIIVSKEIRKYNYARVQNRDGSFFYTYIRK